MPSISKLFDYFPGNHGLTEEIIYGYQPTTLDDRVPIFSGSQDNIIPIGYIRKNALNKAGVKVVYFEPPCLVLTKDGSAGLLTYMDESSGIFTINHHACILRLKGKWKHKLDPEWFAFQNRRGLYQYVTSKSDNMVFSTKWFGRIDFQVPDYDIQLRQQTKRNKLIMSLKGIDKLYNLANETVKNTSLILDNTTAHTIADIFEFIGGHTGLTEEFIYNNQPNNEGEGIPIYSGATIETNLMGHIQIDAKLGDESIKIHESPCILVSRKGQAGAMRYIEGKRFTINDDAYVLVPKEVWQDKINLRWFAYQYQELFYNLVTSKSDNATFNKEYAKKQKIEIPEKGMQDLATERLFKLDRLIEKLSELKRDIKAMIYCEIL